MPRHRYPIFAALFTTMLIAASHLAHAQQQPEDPAVKPSIELLREAMQVHRDGRQNGLLRSLRQLHDPQLSRMFRHIARSTHPALKVHGLLGLAETDPDHHLDLLEVAAIDNPMMQAELISAALDGEMLGHDQAQQLLEWKDLEPGLKLLVAMLLVRDGQIKDAQVIQNLDQGNQPSLAQRSLTAALRLQLGDADAAQQLDELNSSADPSRDKVRFMLLDAALRNRLDKVGPWGVGIAQDAAAPKSLRLLGLKLGLRTHAPSACETWQAEFAAAGDMSQRMKLALLALELAPTCPKKTFEPMIGDNEPMIQVMGKAGEAVATDQNVSAAMVDLVDLGHPLLTNIAISYARQDAAIADARNIVDAVIKEFKTEPRRNLSQRLDNIMIATRVLAERDPDIAIETILPVLTSPHLHEVHGEVILAGLVGADHKQLGQAIAKLPAMQNTKLNSMRIVLRAKHGLKLSDEEVAQLGLIVRGGAGLPQAFRVQAAWLFLKQHGLADHAMSQLIDPGVAGR